MAASSPLRVGIIGCGEVVQVVHIPTFGYLSDLFRVTYLCDVSRGAIERCAGKVAGVPPKSTVDARELCSSPDVDIVLVANSDEYHALHTIMALENDKICFIEKPMALTVRDADAIIAAEAKSEGKVMIGYMRRYAAAFEDAVKEVGGLDKILYARVRDIIGPNPYFVSQSGTFPQKYDDIEQKDSNELLARREEQLQTAIAKESGVPVNDVSTISWRILATLGSHDLSAMREIIGIPQSVVGASLGFPFWSAIFQYPGFTCTYESGIDNNARFDACIEVISADKTVIVTWDTPFVKGLATNMIIKENVDGAYRETIQRRTFEDPYTREMKVLYECAKNGTAVKTTAADAKEDLKIAQMLLKAHKWE